MYDLYTQYTLYSLNVLGCHLNNDQDHHKEEEYMEDEEDNKEMKWMRRS